MPKTVTCMQKARGADPQRGQSRATLLLAAALLLALAVCLLSAGAVSADVKPAAPAPSTDTDRIRITSAKLVIDNTAKYAEFTGNVQATQGNTTIWADRLKVIYTGEPAQGSPPVGDPGQQEIKEIEAEGNVKINFDDKVAVTDKAVYSSETGVLVLSGANSKVTSDKNSVTGDKIVYNRNNGLARVESSSKKGVEAIIYPKGKGIK